MGPTFPEKQYFDGCNWFHFWGLAKGLLVGKGVGHALRADGAATPAEDEHAKFLLHGIVIPRYRSMVRNADTALAAWQQLEAINASNAARRTDSLLATLSTLRMGKPHCVTTFIGTIEELKYNLEAAGCPVTDRQLSATLLNGLPSEYDMFKVAVKNGNDALPPMATLFERVKDEEERLRCASKSLGMVGLHGGHGANGNGGNSGNSDNPGGGWQDSSRGRGRGRGRRGGSRGGGGRGNGGADNPYKDKECYYCGKTGHIKSICRKLERDLANGTAKGNSKGTGELVFAGLTSSPTANEWLWDTGATVHVCNQRDWFTTLDAAATPTIITYGGGDCVISQTGSVRLRLNTGTYVTLSNVGFDPNCPVNVMSVRQIYKHCYPEAGRDTSIPWRIRSRASGAVIFTADYSEKLGTWWVDASPVDALGFALGSSGGGSTSISGNAPTACCLAGLSLDNTAVKWHRRLGHTSPSNLGLLNSGGMVKGLAIRASDIAAAKSSACEPCILGKIHKVPSPSSANVATSPLERVVTDVFGPLPASIDGERFFVAARDEASGYAWAAPLGYKSDACEELTSAITKFETSYGGRVKVLRSDNGGEFINRPLAAWSRSKGITHETSAPYSPEQNGRAERLGRTIFNYMRTIKISSGLPANRWPELLGAAVCIINRTPYRGLGGVPVANFTGMRPDVSGLRPLGCRAYALIPKERRGKASKLDPRGESGVLLGYEPNCKAYRILLDDGETVRVTKHVTFDEATMPLLAAKSQSDDLDCGASDSDSEDDSPAPARAPQPAPAATGVAAEGGGSESDADAPTGAGGAEATADGDASEAAASGRPQRARRAPDRYTLLGLAAMGITSSNGDPKTHAEAMASDLAAGWLAAEQAEMASHAALGTWDPQPAYDVRGLPTSWVFKTKLHANGSVERLKARLVVCGNLQRPGIDYGETFAPSGRYTSIRALLAVAAAKGMKLAQLDITTAFLNAELGPEDNIYIKMPAGYDDATGAVYRLRRALYGLKQAPRLWHLKAVPSVIAMGAVQSASDPSLFIWRTPHGLAFAYLYVDDILLACAHTPTLMKLKARFLAEYKGRDLGTPSQYCGMSLVLANGTISLGNQLLISQMVSSFGLEEAAPCATPFAAGTELLPEGEPLDTTVHPYSSLVGVLLYIANSTRPDIACACSMLAAQVSRPTKAAWLAALRVARYLKGTAGYTITYGPCTGEAELLVYSDADYAGDKATRRSRSAHVLTLAGGAIGWGSKLQKTVALSTAEAEVVALTSATKELTSATKETIWARGILSDLGVTGGPTQIYTDNQAALALAKSGVISTRTKHIDVAYHFCKECIDAGTIKISYLSTNEMVADSLTKAVPLPKHEYCRKAMGLQ